MRRAVAGWCALPRVEPVPLPLCPACGDDLVDVAVRTVERPGEFGPFSIVMGQAFRACYTCHELYPSGQA